MVSLIICREKHLVYRAFQITFIEGLLILFTVKFSNPETFLKSK